MKIYTYPNRNDWEAICKRPAVDHSSLHETVQSVFERVLKEGDQAILDLTQKFDGVLPLSIRVSEEEIEKAADLISEELKHAIDVAVSNITRFHETQQVEHEQIEVMQGVRCWRKSLPIQRVGLYIPGGTAPLFSTVLMLGLPARIAGCETRILCTPPDKYGNVHPAILYAAQVCGITDVFRAGGIQAVAAMVHGSDSVPAVHKIFGPGNQYVTAAKSFAQLQGVAIDMPAGPSEVLVLADDSANPAFIAADLLSQAEHGKDSQTVLVTTDRNLIDRTNEEINKQLVSLPRRELAQDALSHSFAILVNNMNEACAFSDTYAPEHLIIQTRDAPVVAERIRVAGSVFIGPYSPESAGDYASGTNHTLPTNGFARMYSGVSLDSFVNKVTFQELTREGLFKLGPAVITMAEEEQLMAHANAVRKRLNQG